MAREKGQRFLWIDPAVVERPAGDRPFEHRILGLQQGFDVVDGREPARGDDGDFGRPRQLGGGFEVEALQDAVALDVGVDDGGDAGVLEAQREVERAYRALLGPCLLYTSDAADE